MQMLLLKYMRQQAMNAPQDINLPRYTPVQPRQVTDQGTVHQQPGEATAYSPTRNYTTQGTSFCDGSNSNGYEHYQSY